MTENEFSKKLTHIPIAETKQAKIVGDDSSQLAEAIERVVAARSPHNDAIQSVGEGSKGSFDEVIAGNDEISAMAGVVDALQEPWERLQPQQREVSVEPWGPSPDQVRAELNAALRPLGDVVDGAVSAIVVAAARNHGVDVSYPGSLQNLFGARELAKVREEVASAIQRHGVAEFHTYALRFEDAWRLKAGPLRLDFEGAVTLMEISALARYDAAQLSLHAFFDSVTARLSGSAGVGVDGLGTAWAGGSLSGPGTSGGAFLGFDGAGAGLGVTYGRAEAVAGLDVLGRKGQIGVGVSAGFELGLQLSATVSLKLGPFAASVPNLPIAATTWAAGALADMARDPEKTIEGAVGDVADSVVDVGRFFVDTGSSVVDGIADLLGLGSDEVNAVTKSETGAGGRHVDHYETFEGHNSTWLFVGNAGLDIAKGHAAKGQNNAWLRAADGVHVLAGFFDVHMVAPYTLSMKLRTSENPVDLVFGVCEAPRLDATGPVIMEERQQVLSPTYKYIEMKFTTTSTKRVLIYIGLLGDGTDAWCQIDEFRVQTTTTSFDDHN